MNKCTYFVIEEKHTSTTKLLYHARAEKIHNTNNLLYAIHPHSPNMELVSVNACDTWKEAQDIAAYWNECFSNNGTSYLEWLKGATA